MLIPKRHIFCLAELSAPLSKEFLLIKERVFNKIKLSFSEPIAYEHGVYGQSINHAHLHILPQKNQYYHLKNIKETLFKGLKSSRIESFFQLKDIFKEEGSYFYLEADGCKLAFHTKGQPKGKYLFRDEFARLTGLRGLTNWQSMPHEEKQRNIVWVNLTKDALNGINFSVRHS
jgi:diadenosine tetraphosphate (Ap4A) HIT family hydrolase